MTTYQILVTWSAADYAFVASVPDLPGCAAHGESEVVAIGNARKAIELYLDDLREHGEPVPNPGEYQLISA